MTCILRMIRLKSCEDTGTSISVKFLGVQFSQACWSILFKGQLLYLAPSSKSSTVLGRFLWVLEVAYIAFGETSLTHLLRIKRVDSF